jgi:curved DNA-binding protein CbpA
MDLPKILKFFNLTTNYNEQELKKAYKRLVLQYHPDITQKVSSTPMFQHLTDMYNTLKKALDNRESNRQHHELKKRYETSQDAPVKAVTPNPNRKFDGKLFNELFEQHRIKDINDEGYEKWSNDPKSFQQKSTTALTVYREPAPMVSNIGSSEFYELGVSKVKDFTSRQPNASYMDYRLAHTTSELIDESKIRPRKEYKNIEELERDRAGIRFQMSEKEMRKYHEKKRQEEEMEKKRLSTMKNRDDTVFQTYSKVHNVLTHRILA